MTTPDSTTAQSDGSLPGEVDVAVIGSGFSGLCAAIRMKQEGYEDFVVLERDEEVGGTWWANTYPGCGCDVPSHLYSFSFEPNPDWTRTYSRQPEIRDYLRRCADKYGVRPHIRTHTEVRSAAWDDASQRWEVETSRGPLRARMLIAGAGPLAEPKTPELPGLESFEGKTMHSARWDHDYDLKGKRVASIGTGASAIQYVPAIQPEVEQLHVFQRTPPWIFPHTDRPTTRFERRLYRLLPPAQRLVRALVYAMRESNVLGFVKNPKIMRIPERMARRHMRKQIADTALLEKVTPDYTIGCKRILPSNRWYPALQEPNVELVTGGVAEVRPHAIVGNDGVEREVDTIIFGTGFHVTDMPVAKYVRGRDGRLLDELWQGSPRAHLGTAIPGFPNFFMLLGPNTGLGHNSMVYMIESHVAYVLDALRAMRQRGAATVEVRTEAADGFNRDIERRHEGTVWTTGCSSWYLDDTGRNATLWPDWTFRFRQRTRRFDPAEYELGRVTAPRPEPATA
ncbi:MAG: flavin-containing monooxygenase [Thermoleophilaceae bacterium]